MNAASPTFFARNEFLIRRLHSLSGLIPVGAYMTVHLLVNSTLMNGPGAFQENVNKIHDLGAVLPVVEWTFIFLPLLFHMLVGLWIIQSGHSNTGQYKYVNNRRYTWQRWTGVIATVFILFHVFHLHGWFHSDWWLKTVAEPLGGARFKPYNAASTLVMAMSGYAYPVIYVIGMLSCVFHLANGIWTMGITWGVWLTPKAQQRANWVCGAFGVFLAIVGLSSLVAVKTTKVEDAIATEDKIYRSRVDNGIMKENPHKRSDGHTPGVGIK